MARVTARLLRKNSQTEPIPDTCPLMTWEKLVSVGCDGQQVGVSE